jgi:small redox-active disulfide protein 2
MRIEILGMGCAKCTKLEENVRQAVRELGLDAEIDHIRDLAEIAKRGVLLTPGLVIDGRPVSAGKVLSVENVKDLIQKHGQ